MKTLADFKRHLQNGGTIELINFATYSDNYDKDGNHEGVKWNDHNSHRGYGIKRKAEHIQTKSVKLEGGSWLDLDPASCWSFDGDTATRTQITENWVGGYDENDNYQAKLYKRSEFGNKLVYKVEA